MNEKQIEWFEFKGSGGFSAFIGRADDNPREMFCRLIGHDEYWMRFDIEWSLPAHRVADLIARWFPRVDGPAPRPPRES